jgi:hypothetical protein
MIRLFIASFLFLFIFCGPVLATGHFEVKLKDAVIFNSQSSAQKLIRLERAMLSELDLMSVSYLENNTIPDGDYELRLQSANGDNEVIFANDVSSFVFHMSWVLQRQFIGKLINVSLICKKDPGGTPRELKVPIFDLELY